MGVQLRMAGGSNLLHNSNSFVILPLLFASITLVVFGTGTSASPAGYDFLPIEDVYVRPMKRGAYNYWQAFGSDGMAGLYDFVKRTPGQREVRSSYASFGSPNNEQPSYDQYSSGWYRQPD